MQRLRGIIPSDRLSMRFILFGVLVLVLLVGLLTMQQSGQRSAPVLLGAKSVERATLSNDGFLTNSKFVVTKGSRSYDVNSHPSCWIRNCDKTNNWRAFESCDFQSPISTELNSLGVRSMERYVGSSGEQLDGLSNQLLQDAYNFFSNASATANHRCWSAVFNWALVSTKLKLYDQASERYAKALEISNNDELKAIVHVHWGLNEELKGSSDKLKHYDLARSTEPKVEQDYWGVATTAQDRKQLMAAYGPAATRKALIDLVLYKHFASVSIARYSLLQPGTQDHFIENRYTVLRHVLPPFVLQAIQRCFREMIDSGQLKYGDGQSDRYVAYNDRCARFIHYQLADLVRTSIAHNAVPSYTYFGGYKGGSVLKPHTDRAACEFTLSLNIQQYPHDKPWTLSAGKTALFEKDDNWRGRNPEMIPDEKDTVNADLYSGDGFLFMGRHLVHFRRGALPEGHWTNQVFLHFVQEDFKGELA
jgi:tetratricopeptide (TPR) repeat protein